MALEYPLTSAPSSFAKADGSRRMTEKYIDGCVYQKVLTRRYGLQKCTSCKRNSSSLHCRFDSTHPNTVKQNTPSSPWKETDEEWRLKSQYSHTNQNCLVILRFFSPMVKTRQGWQSSFMMSLFQIGRRSFGSRQWMYCTFFLSRCIMVTRETALQIPDFHST